MRPGTLAGIAIVVYAAADLAHEGLGHGLACLAAGGRPARLTAFFLECRAEGLAPAAARLLSASGTLVNLAFGLAAWLALRGRPRAPATRYALWLAMTVNLLQGTGYLLFSGLAGIGDWAAVVAGPWRAGLVVAGAAGYAGTIRLAVTLGKPMLGGRSLAWRSTLAPYLIGGALYLAAGLFQPYGVIAAAAASLGGTSALGWMAAFMRWPAGELRLGGSKGWMLGGLVVGAVFVGVVGPGVEL